MRELILDHNILKCLDPCCFASLPRLRRLHLGHNGLRSLAHLSSLTRLQFLHFGANRITEVTELDRLTNLTSLTEVWLVDNLVAKKQWYGIAHSTLQPQLFRCAQTLARFKFPAKHGMSCWQKADAVSTQSH